MIRLAGYFLVVVAAGAVWIAVDQHGEWAFTAGASLFGVASVALGVSFNRWPVCLAALLVIPAFFAIDGLWAVDVIDRSEEYEPIPVAVVSPFVAAVTVPLIAAGVAARRLVEVVRGRRAYSSRTSAPPGAN